MNRRDMILAATVATLWGFNFVVIDWGMHDVPPLLFAAIRFTLVVLPAVFFVPRPSAPWRTVAAVGVFMSLGQFGLLYVAMDAGLPPGLAALAGQHHPAPHSFQERHLGLPFQALDLLRDRARREAQRLGGGHDRATVVDGPQRGQRGKINHEAMLHR